MMFGCEKSLNSAHANLETLYPFVEDGTASFGLLLDAGTVTSLLGIEVYQLYGALVSDISKIVRDLIQNINTSTSNSHREDRRHRLEITRFLRLVLGSATSMKDSSSGSVTMIKNCLPKLIDALRAYGWKCVYEKESKGHEVFHCTLEWHWLIILISKEILKLQDDNEENYRTSEMTEILESFGSRYRDLVIELLEVVFYQFTNNTIEDAFRESPFICGCVEKVWLGMMSIAEKSNGAIDFWAELWSSMPTVLNDRKDGFLFKIWIINGLIKLYDIKMQKDDVEMKLLKLPSNNAIINEFVRELVQSECREEHLRTCLILLKPIITGLWPVRHEPLIVLWDFFVVRLNSRFHLKNEMQSSEKCTTPSIAELIEEATILAESRSTLDAVDYKINSFRMFLIILASITRYYTMQANKTTVHMIFNGIFNKLGPKKYENISEQGIYNLGLMLLTILMVTSFQEDYSRVSKQIQMVRIVCESSNLSTDSIIKRGSTAIQAHMAVLVVLSNSASFDKTSHIRVLLQNIENAYKKYGYRFQPALQVAAEGTVLLFEKSVSQGLINRGEHNLIGSWIVKYLQGSTDTEWHKLLDAIANAMQSQTGSSDDISKAVKEHLYAAIKERYSKKRSAPTCIPRIAAQLTIFAAKCMESLLFRSMISDFIHCPTAHSDQVLHYLNEIIQCPTIMVLLDETTVMRQWLKMGLVYGRDELLEFTRIVHGLSEFKFLCDIPAYDLLEKQNEVPIKLFFQFVGKRFREADAATQLEMKIKLHSIFQHFHKWIPEPTNIVKQRILSVLVLALKECPQGLYIQSNSTCLYHLAFQHYFLPFSVLTDRNVAIELIEDMSKVWHKVMDFLGNMEFNRNQIVGDHVINMLTKWVPQFAKLPNETAALRPLTFFFSMRNEELVLFAMPRFLTTYVELKRCLPQPHAGEVMELLHRLLKDLNHREYHDKTALFIRVAGLQIITHAFMCNETFPTRTLAREIVYSMLATTDSQSDIINQEMCAVMSTFTRKNMGMAPEAYFTFLCRLVNRHPTFIHSQLDMIREELTMAERLRGRGIDKFLRDWLIRLERVIDSAFTMTNFDKRTS